MAQVTRAEAAVVDLVLDDVNQLVAFWEAVQESLVAASRDPQFVALVGAGATELSFERTQQLMRQVRRELDELRQQTAQWAARTVPANVRAGSTEALEDAARQGFSGSLGGSLGQANEQAMREIIEEIATDLDFAASSAQRTMRRHFRLTQQAALPEVAINQALLASEARLENIDQAAKRLRREFAGATGNGQFVNVAGKRWELSTYSRLVANTRLSEAANQGALNAAMSMGTDLVRVSDHGPTDPICDQFAGKVFSISGRSSRFPALRRRPPFHPNCRHVLLPFIPDLKTPQELAFAEARSRGDLPPGASIEDFVRASA